MKRIILGLMLSAAVMLFVLLPGGSAGATNGNSVTTPDSGLDASLVVDASGNPVVSYAYIDGSTYYLAILHCNDPRCIGGDESLTTPDPDAGPNDVGFDSSIALDASGNPVVSYVDATDDQLKVLHCDDPNCAGTENVNSVAATGTAPDPSLQLDSSGNPVVSFYDSAADDLKLLHCNDANCAGGNESLTTPVSTGLVGRFSSLALDASDRPAISYYDETDDELQLVDCNDPNCVPPEINPVLDDAFAVGKYSSLELDATGNPVVAYVHDSLADDLKIARCSDPSCLGPITITTVDTSESSLSGGDVLTGVSLELDSSGSPVVSYGKRVISGNTNRLHILHCADGNCAGGGIITPFSSYEAVETSLALDSSGNPAVAFIDASSFSDLNVLDCADPNCWGDSTVRVDSTGGGYASITLDAAGNPVISYLNYSGGNPLLGIAHCSDPKCVNRTINSPDVVDTGFYTSLALDASGNPVVSHYDIANGDLKILHCNDPACAGGDESITAPHTTGDVGPYTSLKLDGSGFPVVSYYDATNDDLYLMHCDDPNCAGTETPVVQNTVGDIGRYTSLELDASGFPVVSYYDATNGDLRILHCNDVNCSGTAESTTSPDTGGDVGIYTSLELDASGFPVVSYYDSSTTALKLIHCNDPNCAGGNESITAPDTVGSVGKYTSLALDSSGSPVVSYYYQTSGDLKILHCNDPACAGGDESIATPDTANDVGTYSSLTQDSAGNPVVSYYDETNGSLRLLHCNDAKCKPGVKSACPDMDGDMLCDDTDPNTDGDGCPNAKEQQTAVGSELTGGRRNYLNPNDYFEASHNGQVRINDIVLVVNQYFIDDNDGNPGLPPYANVNYNPDTDRTDDPGSTEAWDLLGPNGLQRVDDILHAVKQYFHDCS